MTPEIERGVLEWATEIRVLLDACRQLVEYYGTDEEGDSFRSALDAPLWLVSALEQVVSGAQVDTTKGPAPSKSLCGEVVATMISPLLRIVVEWEPTFLYETRQALDAGGQKRVIVPYGQFLGTVGMNLCGPMWKTYPDLAPPGWPG